MEWGIKSRHFGVNHTRISEILDIEEDELQVTYVGDNVPWLSLGVLIAYLFTAHQKS